MSVQRLGSGLVPELLINHDDDIIGWGSRSLQDRKTTTEMSHDVDALRELGIVDDDGNLIEDEHQVHATYFSSGIAIVDLNPDD